MSESARFVTIGGTQLRGASVFPRVIWRTYRALRAAKAAPGCTHAEIFRDGRRYFNMSVWTDMAAMKAFARTGVHDALMRSMGTDILDFQSITVTMNKIPDRPEAMAIWLAQTGKT